ncbi:uncharacterized protein [Montipora foliosa]|uniref:uncharacterized protein n=1 Tax=Montipora foliosa TaxID=591990 RepID=UPI0035F100FC
MVRLLRFCRICGSAGSFIIVLVTFTVLVVMATVMDTGLASSASMTCDADWMGLDVSLFAFDFDGTCTQKDTTGLLYKATEKYHASTELEMKQLDAHWSELGKKYWTGHQETVAKSISLHSTFGSGYNEMGLRSLLQEVYHYNHAMMKEVEASELLKGISRESIKETAKEVKLYPGCLNVLNQINLPLYLITVNWCQDLIHAKLGHLKHLKIFGNNLPLEGELSSGSLAKNLTSAFDKETIFQELVQSKSRGSGGMSIFVGDSITDLLALLKSDIGIVIGKSHTVRKVAKSFGIKLLPLQEIQNMMATKCHEENSETSKEGVLFEAPSWNEIGFTLFGTNYTPSK